jgi:hypothetical protein
MPAERKVRTVWEVTTPRSEEVTELRPGEETTMREWLERSGKLLPNFQKPVVQKPVVQAGVKESSPDPLDLSIQRTTEEAYQRAFFLQGSTKISGAIGGSVQINWLDIEVTLVGGDSPRRLDMIGAVGDDSYVVVELKAAKGASPFEAIQKVLSYACSVRGNELTLASHPSWTTDSDRGDIPDYSSNTKYKGKYLVVGGPKGYWADWKDHWGLIFAAGTKWLVESGLVGYRLIFVEFPDIDFKGQKGDRATYTPRVDSEVVWTALFEACATGSEQ